MEPPVYHGTPVALVNRRYEDRLAMHCADRFMAPPADRAGNLGPLKYNIEPAQKWIRPGSASCKIGTELRLGYVLVADKSKAESSAAGQGAAAATAAAGGAAGTSGDIKSPRSWRLVGLPGRGHWMDGIATGTTIPGVYNRFRVQIPGAAAYNVAKADATTRPHSARASFGTSPRFPWEKAIQTPKRTESGGGAFGGGVGASNNKTRIPKPPSGAKQAVG
jgi:hypothetical protein